LAVVPNLRTRPVLILVVAVLEIGGALYARRHARRFRQRNSGFMLMTD
jgi:hypothetical protein